jgi:2-beta-glucuronyltransferase
MDATRNPTAGLDSIGDLDWFGAKLAMQEVIVPGKPKKSVVFVSAVHDFRILRRGSIQSLASAMVKMGHAVTFVSVRFSLLSILKGDSRTFLWRKSNRPERVKGVLCYLWFTMLHPFQSNSKLIESLLWPLYLFYKRSRNGFLDDSFRNADFIVIESGHGILFAERARRLNPAAKIIYRASDKLSIIGASGVLQAELEKNAKAFDWFCLLSADMDDEFAWASEKTFCVPLGIDPEEYKNNGPNPYVLPVNAISVGSMLFDPSFFQIAAVLFPSVEFHLIGCGTTFSAPPNVKIYPEMAFKDTLRYIEYASFGVAPYRATEGAGYLATSSLKLKQYEYMGIPAVCPSFAVGQSKNRFGYFPMDGASIKKAINDALGSAFVVVPPPMDWQEISRRLLDPKGYPDCDLTATAAIDSGAAGLSVTASAAVISLVLCTVGERKRELIRLIRSLKAQEFTAYEIILVDQNPPGYLDEIFQAEFAGLVVKRVFSDRGLSIARNVGLQNSKGEIVGFPDDDCWYPSDTLTKVVLFFQRNRRIDVLLGRTVDRFGAPSLSPLRKESGTVTRTNIWISGNSNTLFVRKDAIPPSGFDEKLGVGASSRYQSGEETDFVLTLMEKKSRAVYVSDLKICHDQVDDIGTGRLLKRAWMYSFGFGFVLKKHNFGFLYLLYRFGRSILSGVWGFVRLKPAFGLSRMLWSLGTVIGYSTAKR